MVLDSKRLRNRTSKYLYCGSGGVNRISGTGRVKYLPYLTGANLYLSYVYISYVIRRFGPLANSRRDYQPQCFPLLRSVLVQQFGNSPAGCIAASRTTLIQGRQVLSRHMTSASTTRSKF